MAIFVMYLAKPVVFILAKRVVVYLAIPIVYLAICRVFNFFVFFKIVVVYLAIFVVYLAKPFSQHRLNFNKCAQSTKFQLFLKLRRTSLAPNESVSESKSPFTIIRVRCDD